MSRKARESQGCSSCDGWRCGMGREEETSSHAPITASRERARPPSYRQGPADAGEHTVETEEVDQVKDEDHYQVAHGDHFEEAVGAIVDRKGAPHADEGDQQGDLWQRRGRGYTHFCPGTGGGGRGAGAAANGKPAGCPCVKPEWMQGNNPGYSHTNWLWVPAGGARACVLAKRSCCCRG